MKCSQVPGTVSSTNMRFNGPVVSRPQLLEISLAQRRGASPMRVIDLDRSASRAIFLSTSITVGFSPRLILRHRSVGQRRLSVVLVVARCETGFDDIKMEPFVKESFSEWRLCGRSRVEWFRNLLCSATTIVVPRVAIKSSTLLLSRFPPEGYGPSCSSVAATSSRMRASCSSVNARRNSRSPPRTRPFQ